MDGRQLIVRHSGEMRTQNRVAAGAVIVQYPLSCRSQRHQHYASIVELSPAVHQTLSLEAFDELRNGRLSKSLELCERGHPASPAAERAQQTTFSARDLAARRLQQ
jgi:hypothetical protein